MRRSLPKLNRRKVIGAMKDKLDQKIMKEFIELSAETYGYLIYDGSGDKKNQRHKSVMFLRKKLKRLYDDKVIRSIQLV